MTENNAILHVNNFLEGCRYWAANKPIYNANVCKQNVKEFRCNFAANY